MNSSTPFTYVGVNGAPKIQLLFIYLDNRINVVLSKQTQIIIILYVTISKLNTCIYVKIKWKQIKVHLNIIENNKLARAYMKKQTLYYDPATIIIN